MKNPTEPATDLLDAELRSQHQTALGMGTHLEGESEFSQLLSHLRGTADDISISPSVLYNHLLQPRLTDGPDSGSLTHGPEWNADSISINHSLISVTGPAQPQRRVLPGINDEIYGFRLLHELGRGSFARVFLAKQGDLADREVVLKISAIEGTEPQTLAQLQHTHVVPIYSVHDDAKLGLRAVCMPYFGGASLTRVLEKIWEGTSIPANGRALIEALDQVSGPEPAVRSSRQSIAAEQEQTSDKEFVGAQTARVTLSGLNFVQAAAWIIARLAEGLHHSHERNVLHRDIKPSNILLSAEAQPLLLDFNVSQAVDCDPTQATIGGTIAYMAPEQLLAMRDRTAESNALVDHRSDVYSLGLVLYEMLSGTNPFTDAIAGGGDLRGLQARIEQRERPVASLKANCRLDIPWSLESIVRKSLAPIPAERYASAAQLAEDLTRFLQDLPLKFAPELSRLERARKWTRRHPRLTTAGVAVLIATALFIPGVLLLSITRDDLAAKQSLLADSRAADQARDFQAGAQRALHLINSAIPNEETLPDGQAAAEQALAIFGVIVDPRWQDGPSWRRIEKARRSRLAESVREILLMLASAHTREAPDNTAATQVALDLVRIAEQIRDLPPSRALHLDRARYLTQLNRVEEAQQAIAVADKIPVVTAHDIYMLASAHARSESAAGYREAVKLLDTAIEMSPEHYWSHFVRALCLQELGQPILAVSDLGACIGLWPESSWAYFNRGYMFFEQGLKKEAVGDFTQAIHHSPRFVSAYFNRGLARLELREYAAALSDFEKAQELGRTDQVLNAGRAMALEGLQRHAEADQLFASILDQNHARSGAALHRLSWTYAFAVAHRKPQISSKIFDRILSQDPKHPQALYGKGMLLMEQGKLPVAVRMFDDALIASPAFMEPLRYRAVALARLGDLQQAAADANACIEREKTNPDSLYIAACVASISFRKLATPELKQQTLLLLQSAIECGAERDRALSDPDFSALRGDPEFLKLVGAGAADPEHHRSDSF